MHQLKKWLQSETVLACSALLALLSLVLNPPTKTILTYIDLRVLALLFSLMAVIAGLQATGSLQILSNKLLQHVTNTRSLTYILIMISFFSSMLITNDVALITFVPFTIIVLGQTKQQRLMALIIVLETIAANLGSMLTPVGNPQNLYLYSHYQLSLTEFFQITFPLVLASFLLLSLITLTVKATSLTLNLETMSHLTSKNCFVFYCILFILALGTVFRLIDYRLSFMLILGSILLRDWKLLLKVDYGLLATFFCFFIFVGNLSEITIIRTWIDTIIDGQETLAAIILSQVISNVPATLLLSGFTADYRSLIIGTNLGGLGTLIASLASLISYKFYIQTSAAKPLNYLGLFTFWNLVILLILLTLVKLGL